MNANEAAHQSHFSKEVLEIIAEFNETERLMREQDSEGLLLHSHRLVIKYPLEASVYNLIHPYPPCTLEQAGEACVRRRMMVRVSGFLRSKKSYPDSENGVIPYDR